MNKDEAVQKLATAGRLSIAHAEDLYDSFFEKPVVPQYVADWYEEHKKTLEYDLWIYLVSWEQQKPNDFKNWINIEENAFQTLVNMHQFGYEVEKEKRYRVKFKGMRGDCDYLNHGVSAREWFMCSRFNFENVRTHFTHKELEDAGFGWVFDCEGIEVEEVE